jgi:hypothetical protein
MSSVTLEEDSNVTTAANRFAKIVEEACNKRMPKGSYRGGKKAAFR